MTDEFYPDNYIKYHNTTLCIVWISHLGILIWYAILIYDQFKTHPGPEWLITVGFSSAAVSILIVVYNYFRLDTKKSKRYMLPYIYHPALEVPFTILKISSDKLSKDSLAKAFFFIVLGVWYGETFEYIFIILLTGLGLCTLRMLLVTRTYLKALREANELMNQLPKRGMK
ncbi:hypothetical protein QV08_01520 [Gallibacterium salpingitidis]|uniref:Uncharacterized protein n=1 Tax=Gallibacterium salpingitidis TaxID=505341 RepID=A0AB36E189_9PAST|nr:hypothetical protein [Gallibacterium salpingitidis]OBX09072.1 hypothetical protein QV09_08605 [Gallibacterium salpingitidis]OBX09640.1 hypothetical protein QV08_01520 [Gallibacterium salpingitidis]